MYESQMPPLQPIPPSSAGESFKKSIMKLPAPIFLQNMTLKKKVELIMLFLLPILTFWVYSSVFNSSPNNMIKPPENAKQLSTWLNYTDQKNGYTFKYPKNWEILSPTSTKDLNILLSGPNEGIVAISTNTSPFTVDTVNYKIIKENQTVIDGKNAKEITYQSKDASLFGKVASVKKSDKEYLFIKLTYTKINENIALNTFNGIIKTFRFQTK